MQEVTLQVTFKVGTLEEIGMGGLKQNWIDTEDPRNPARQFNLTCGAGLGSSLIEASANDSSTGRHLYAQASITPLARSLFDALGAELDKPETAP